MVPIITQARGLLRQLPATLASIAILFALITWSAEAQEKKSLTQEERIEMLEQKLESVTQELQRMKETAPPEQGDRLSGIEKRLDILADEIEGIKAQGAEEKPVYEEKYGHAQGAAKVYGIAKGLSIGGYGEIISEFKANDDNIAQALRSILYVGYKYSDRIVFDTEIEFEHASTGSNLDGEDGEVSVEFANLDFMLNDYINFRAGLNLVPFGIINEVHEPTTFHGVLRPDVERQIIPSTWSEVGVGIFGKFMPGLTYRAYAIDSLDSRGFKASNIRGGRGQGNRSRINDVAFVTRVEYEPIEEARLGTSFYIGNTGQNEKVEGKTIDGTLTMYEIDYQFHWRGFESRALFAYTWLGDAGLINANNGFEGEDSVGKQTFGFYVEGAYDVLPILFDTSHYLAPFIRYEKYDTQKKVPSGFMRNPANDRQTITYGLDYKPIPNVVLKADFQDRRNEDDSAKNQFNLGIGWVF